MRSANIEYSEKLDQLRFAACLMVIVHHVVEHFYNPLTGSPSNKLVPNPLTVFIIDGYVSVPLFLALSGFLFARICRKGRLSVSKFYSNRIVRIYPLYIFALLFFIHLSTFSSDRWSVLFSILTLRDTSYFFRIDGIQQLWTISVELCFCSSPCFSGSRAVSTV